MAEYGELGILKVAEEVADAIWDRVNEMNEFSKDTLGKQMVRAADSIGANLAEACGRFHFGDKLQFLYYARGSLFETKYWINRAARRDLISDREAKATIEALSSLARQLNAFVKGLRNVKQQYASDKASLREEAETYAVTVEVAELFDANALAWLADSATEARLSGQSPNY
jgi:four helix bundle protein